jgi:hypothetical protein
VIRSALLFTFTFALLLALWLWLLPTGEDAVLLQDARVRTVDLGDLYDPGRPAAPPSAPIEAERLTPLDDLEAAQPVQTPQESAPEPETEAAGELQVAQEMAAPDPAAWAALIRRMLSLYPKEPSR